LGGDEVDTSLAEPTTNAGNYLNFPLADPSKAVPPTILKEKKCRVSASRQKHSIYCNKTLSTVGLTLQLIYFFIHYTNVALPSGHFPLKHNQHECSPPETS